MSTAGPSSTTARSLTTSSTPPSPRQAIRAMVVGLALTLVALVAPVVDELTAGTLAAHLRAVYAGSGVATPAASAVTAYLVGLGALGALGWVATIRAARRGRRSAPVMAAAFLVLGVALAVLDLTVTEYGHPILPTWLGVLCLLPALPGLVAVVLLSRRTRRAPY